MNLKATVFFLYIFISFAEPTEYTTEFTTRDPESTVANQDACSNCTDESNSTCSTDEIIHGFLDDPRFTYYCSTDCFEDEEYSDSNNATDADNSTYTFVSDDEFADYYDLLAFSGTMETETNQPATTESTTTIDSGTSARYIPPFFSGAALKSAKMNQCNIPAGELGTSSMRFLHSIDTQENWKKYVVFLTPAAHQTPITVSLEQQNEAVSKGFYKYQLCFENAMKYTDTQYVVAWDQPATTNVICEYFVNITETTPKIASIYESNNIVGLYQADAFFEYCLPNVGCKNVLRSTTSFASSAHITGLA